MLVSQISRPHDVHCIGGSPFTVVDIIIFFFLRVRCYPSTKSVKMLFKRSLFVLALTALSAHANPSQSQSLVPRSIVSDTKSREVTQTARSGAVSATDKKAVAGAAGFVIMDSAVRKLFTSNGISFPSQLAGCIMLLSTMIVTDVIKPGLGDKIFESLTPGANLLAKWCVSSCPGYIDSVLNGDLRCFLCRFNGLH
jgi:hypothetical protein